MAKSDWKSIPWEEDSKAKQAVDFLMDILCDIANYRARLPRLRTVKEEDTLSKNVLSTFEELNNWWETWGLPSGLSCVETQANNQNSVFHDAEGPVLETILQYHDVWTAHNICTYDAARILLLGLLTALIPRETLSMILLEVPNSTPLLGRTSDTKGLALEIIRSLDDTNAHYENFMGTYCVALIIDIAYTSFEPSSRIRRWLWDGEEGTELEKEILETRGAVEKPLRMLPTCQVSRGRWLYRLLKCQVSS
jgi:hypothetical protein